MKSGRSGRARAAPTITATRHTASKKIGSLRAVAAAAARARRAGKIVVTTGGCFDILHVGHIRNLEWAKSQGDVLIIGVNSDESVRMFKDPTRPIVSERERAEVIAALGCVDHVLIFKERAPNRWLAAVRPHIHVKGSDRPMSEILERHVVRRGGGKIVFFQNIPGKSTTSIIERIARTAKKRR